MLPSTIVSIESRRLLGVSGHVDQQLVLRRVPVKIDTAACERHDLRCREGEVHVPGCPLGLATQESGRAAPCVDTREGIVIVPAAFQVEDTPRFLDRSFDVSGACAGFDRIDVLRDRPVAPDKIRVSVCVMKEPSRVLFGSYRSCAGGGVGVTHARASPPVRPADPRCP